MVLEHWVTFVLRRTAGGGTRFVIGLTFSGAKFPVSAARRELMSFELPHFIMERRTILETKALAGMVRHARSSD